MIPYFQSLGERIERAWLCHSYNEDVFPGLALNELERDPPLRHVTPSDIIDFTFDACQPFMQPGSRELFGQPPVMVFQAARFYIEALFWLSGTTDIHEHAFSGAFSVLAGSSVHSQWRFTQERVINSRMRCGRLDRISTKILRQGDIQLIYSGGRVIHQLFHLDVPSVTIVVRTYVDRDHLPQFRYKLPGLALAYEERDSLQARRMMFIAGMARGQIAGLREYSRRLISSGDLETVFETFSTLLRHKVDSSFFTELLDAAREFHGDAMDLFKEALDGERRVRVITALRSKISAPEPRFLLALLMLMPDRDSILEAIRLQFPDTEPIDMIETWLTAISGKDIIGFNFNDINRLIFRGLVDRLDTDSLVLQIKGKFGDDSPYASLEWLQEHVRKMTDSELFRPLFSSP